jgi:hypothetical protein
MGQFLPQVLGPQGLPPITDPVVARENPELTVLSAVALAGTEAASAIVEALPAAIPGLDPSLIPGYLGMVFAALPQALRARLEALMRQPIFADVKLPPSIQAVLDAGRAEGRTEGRTEGEARGELHGRAASILAILEARAIPVPADVRDEILACTDLPTLERWLRRAATLKRARAVVRPPRAVGA